MLKVERVVIRTPFYPFDSVNQWSNFKAALLSPYFREALFLASPSLYNELVKSAEDLNGETFLSLYKYFLRMSFRCTPFGMFSGVSTGAVGPSSFLVKPRNEYYKHTRLDNHFLNSFIQKISKDETLRNEIKWFANNTFYSDGSNIRYVEYTLTSNQRSHNLSKVERSEYLESILQATTGGAQLKQLIRTMVSSEVTEDDAKGFINELIESKLLLSELEPVVTGEEPGIRLLTILSRCESAKTHFTFLSTLLDIIHQIDEQGTGADLSLYQRIVDLIKDWDDSYDPKLIFQSDLSKPVEQIQVGEDIVAELRKALNFLAKLNIRSEPANLKAFRDEFSKRFEDAEVPLLTVMDTESGLGYPVNAHSGSDRSPSLQGLAFTFKPTSFEHKVAAWQKRLMQLYQSCLQEGKMEIVLTDETFDIHNTVDEEAFSDSLYSICSILGAPEEVVNGNFTIDFRGSSGPSAADLLGRFCYAHPEIHEITSRLIADEERLHPEKIYAEIVHLAQARIGNVLLRPSLREYEIPILTFSGVDQDHTIQLDDLMVSVRNHKIILRSKRLNKEVVPRNTNAHNYSANTIPHYHFLCDLKNQETTLRFNWDWGVLNEFKFLPRITYGKTILSKARWVLGEKDLGTLDQLPRQVVLSQGDNHLPLNLDDDMCVSILRQELKRSKTVVMHECLFNKDNLTVRGPEGGFTNEFIIPWTKSTVNSQPETTRGNKGARQQNFFPGSEWHYVKLYCGTKTSDKILAEVIKPLADELLSEDVINQWFFIRYNDPDLHLRVRFRGSGDFFSIVTNRLNEMLADYLQHGHVWKIQTDTYKRELDRYGYENVEASESLFFYDSVAIAEILQLLDGDEGENIRWQFALKGINDLLNDFGYTSTSKGEILGILRDRFAKEFNATDRASQKLLSEQYRKLRKEIELSLQPNVSDDHDFAPIWAIFERRSNSLRPIVCQIMDHNSNQSLVNLLGSYLHMFVNRFMRSNQRMHEMVCYDFLCQYYKSEIAKSKKKVLAPDRLYESVK